MRTRRLAVAGIDGVRDALRFWPLLLAAFLHAIVSCLLLGLSFQQASEAQEVNRHLQRWEQGGAASLRGLYLSGSDLHDTGAEQDDTLPSEDGREASSAEPAEAGATGGAERVDALVAMLADPQRTAYTMDPYGDRFGDDLPGAIVVTEDFLAASGLEATLTPTGQEPARETDGTSVPYVVLGSASTARDPYALTVDGVLPPTSRVRFQDTMIPVVGRLAPGATALDPMMGSVPLDEAVVVVVAPTMLAALYEPDTLDALLLRTVALGRDALPTLDAAARPLESEALVVTAEPLSAESSPLLQSLSSSSRTLLVLFGAAVLGAVVSLFGALGVLTRTLAPTWRIATMVGAARWQVALRIAVPVLLAWVLPAGVGLAAGAAVLPGPPSPALMAAALVGVLAVGATAALSSWRSLAATFGTYRRRPRPDASTTGALTKEPA